jgi:hypothetical protein
LTATVVCVKRNDAEAYPRWLIEGEDGGMCLRADLRSSGFDNLKAASND